MKRDFEGYEPRECGEHRTLGYRAWCYECQEYCYPELDMACKGCRIPILEARIRELSDDEPG